MTEDPAVIENVELLRREWGHAYAIWSQAGLCRAARRDNAAIFRRPKPDDLRKEMDTDYQACLSSARVNRDHGGEGPTDRAARAAPCRPPVETLR